MIKGILAAIFSVAALCVLGFVFTGANVFTYAYWGPKQAAAQHQVFVNSDPYINGKIEHLTRLRYDYQTAPDEDHRLALKTMILSEASSINPNYLPTDLRAFISQLQGGL